jgi:hypothetical protein
LKSDILKVILLLNDEGDEDGEGELLKKRPVRKGSKEIDLEGLTSEEIVNNLELILEKN